MNKKIRPVWQIATMALLLFHLSVSANADPGIWTGNDGSVSIVDSLGRTVQIPARVNRIGCLYLFTGHVVTLLGRGSDIVAVSNGLKRVSLLHRICPAILDAAVPKAQGAINVEELLAAAPDVVFLPGDVAGDRADMSKLDRFRIPYIVIDFSDIRSQQAAIRIIGQAIGAPERAERFIAYYDDCIRRTRDTVRQIPRDLWPRLYYAVNEPLRTTLAHGLVSDWLRVTGCVNVALGREERILEGKNYTSLEQVLSWNPDVILVNEPRAAETIRHDVKWAHVSAVRKRRVLQMPIGISRWGHPGSMETPLAILWAAKKLHPKRFSHIDMTVETRNFYHSFFNYDLSGQMTERILSGRTRRKPKHQRE